MHDLCLLRPSKLLLIVFHCCLCFRVLSPLLRPPMMKQQTIDIRKIKKNIKNKKRKRMLRMKKLQEWENPVSKKISVLRNVILLFIAFSSYCLLRCPLLSYAPTVALLTAFTSIRWWIFSRYGTILIRLFSPHFTSFHFHVVNGMNDWWTS